MTARSLTAGIPIWVRVTAIVALVLVGVVVGSLLLGRTSAAGHGSSGHGQMDQMERMDHGAGSQPTGGVAQTGHGGTPAPSGQHTPSVGGRGH